MGSDSNFSDRKGAARIALIPPEVLDALNAGRIPTVNLNEFLALDLPLLARNVARVFYALAEPRPERDRIAHALATHASDAVRCWAAQWIAFSSMPLAGKLASTWRFAADPHFGVRELA